MRIRCSQAFRLLSKDRITDIWIRQKKKKKELTAWWKARIDTQFLSWLRSSVVKACDWNSQDPGFVPRRSCAVFFRLILLSVPLSLSEKEKRIWLRIKLLYSQVVQVCIAGDTDWGLHTVTEFASNYAHGLSGPKVKLLRRCTYRWWPLHARCTMGLCSKLNSNGKTQSQTSVGHFFKRFNVLLIRKVYRTENVQTKQHKTINLCIRCPALSWWGHENIGKKRPTGVWVSVF